MKAQNNTNSQLLKVYAHYIRETHTWRANQTDEEITKDIFDIFRTENGGIISIDNPGRLETEFWIGEGHGAGRTYNEATQLCKDINQNKAEYFIAENTRTINYELKVLDRFINYKNGDDFSICGSDLFYILPYDPKDQKNPLRTITHNLSHFQTELLKAEEATLADALALKAVLLKMKEAQVKRCNTYLKRYGTEKMHAKTYWADR